MINLHLSWFCRVHRNRRGWTKTPASPDQLDWYHHQLRHRKRTPAMKKLKHSKKTRPLALLPRLFTPQGQLVRRRLIYTMNEWDDITSFIMQRPFFLLSANKQARLPPSSNVDVVRPAATGVVAVFAAKLATVAVVVLYTSPYSPRVRQTDSVAPIVLPCQIVFLHCNLIKTIKSLLWF